MLRTNYYLHTIHSMLFIPITIHTLAILCYVQMYNVLILAVERVYVPLGFCKFVFIKDLNLA